jgi:hypothetical protein
MITMAPSSQTLSNRIVTYTRHPFWGYILSLLRSAWFVVFRQSGLEFETMTEISCHFEKIANVARGAGHFEKEISSRLQQKH